MFTGDGGNGIRTEEVQVDVLETCRFKSYSPDFLRMDSSQFDWLAWRRCSFMDLGVKCRFSNLTSVWSKALLREHAIGYCPAELLPCRPKIGNMAVMFYRNGKEFWFHMRNEEFLAVFSD